MRSPNSGDPILNSYLSLILWRETGAGEIITLKSNISYFFGKWIPPFGIYPYQGQDPFFSFVVTINYLFQLIPGIPQGILIGLLSFSLLKKNHEYPGHVRDGRFFQ